MARKKLTEPQEVLVLADKLFALVERNQGYFYVSDGEQFPTKAQFFERVRGRIVHGQSAVKKMQDFLREHGELKRATTHTDKVQG